MGPALRARHLVHEGSWCGRSDPAATECEEMRRRGRIRSAGSSHGSGPPPKLGRRHDTLLKSAPSCEPVCQSRLPGRDPLPRHHQLARLRARAREGNGCAERFIRTLKENLLWVRRFTTVEELRLALQQFRQTYNQGWIVERHGYRTPAQVRAAQLEQVPMAA